MKTIQRSPEVIHSPTAQQLRRQHVPRPGAWIRSEAPEHAPPICSASVLGKQRCSIAPPAGQLLKTARTTRAPAPTSRRCPAVRYTPAGIAPGHDEAMVQDTVEP